MADEDKYEPLARQWSESYKRYVSNSNHVDDLNSECKEIADGALRTVTKMLRSCGGCPLLLQLTNLLWDCQLKMMPGNLFSEDSWQILVHINNQLDVLAKDVANQRIDMVAIRSVRAVAVELCVSKMQQASYHELHNQVAKMMVKDLIRHSFLDKARAFSVGKRFSDGEEAHHFYQQVMTFIESGMEGVVKQFINHLNGKGLRYRSQLCRKQSTRAMLHDEKWRLDA